jgi:hypothetical protein
MRCTSYFVGRRHDPGAFHISFFLSHVEGGAPVAPERKLTLVQADGRDSTSGRCAIQKRLCQESDSPLPPFSCLEQPQFNGFLAQMTELQYVSLWPPTSLPH